MQLKDILDICRANEVEHFEYTVVNGDINTTVTGIASDSRKVTDGGIFVCIVGSVSDGHKYIEQVKDKASGGSLPTGSTGLLSRQVWRRSRRLPRCCARSLGLSR